MADLERHIPMAERLDNDPGDAGRMARSFLAAMRENADLRARLAAVLALCDEWDVPGAPFYGPGLAAKDRAAAEGDNRG